MRSSGSRKTRRTSWRRPGGGGTTRNFLGEPVVGFYRQDLSPLPHVSELPNENNPLLSERRHPKPKKTNNNSDKPHRSGKELWAILRKHVQSETFHIQTKFQEERDDLHFDDVDLPYDFTVTQCALALAAYLLTSILAFSIIFEDFTYIDSMYFAVVTFTTIGYGDLTPVTVGGKLFCSVFALAGVAVLAIALGVFGSKIIEAEVFTITKAEDRVLAEVINMLQSREKQSKRFRQLSFQEHSHASSFDYLSSFDDPRSSFHEDLEDAAHPWHKATEWCSQFSELMARYLPALAPLFLFASVIGHYEGWTWYDVIYYCIVTTTSIGYGDYTPERQSMKLLAVICIPLAVGAMGHFLGTVASFIMDQRSKYFHKRLWRHEITLEDLECMSSSHDGTVTELDFCIFMLKAMKKVDDELMDRIRDHFHALDLTNSGTLVRGDLELMAKRRLHSTRTKLRLSTYKQRLSSSDHSEKSRRLLKSHSLV